MIDRDALVSWLREKRGHRNALIGAVYEGLLARILAGQFDDEESSEDEGSDS